MSANKLLKETKSLETHGKTNEMPQPLCTRGRRRRKGDLCKELERGKDRLTNGMS